ncbi:Efflux pump himE [Paramyrothecium foliicola]|nr:Efflux pump himE [Paramyrothecium foliicola]
MQQRPDDSVGVPSDHLQPASVTPLGTTPSAASTTSEPSRRSSPSIAPLGTPRQSLSMFEFELLHYYIVHVCDTFTPSPVYRPLWCDMAITQAVKHEFLLHLTMMISCLHMALSKSPRLKSAHQDFILAGCSESVKQFQDETKTINESNWRTVGPFTLLISTYALALPLLDDGPKSSQTVIDDMVQVLRLVGGARELSKRKSEGKEEYEDNLLEEKDVCDPSRVVPVEEFDADRVISVLKSFIYLSDNDEQIKAINLKAAHALKEASDYNFINMFRPLVWPNLVENDYLDLVMQRDPVAMAILAHFAITLSAAISLTFKHLVIWYGPRWSLLKPRFYPLVFVGTDFISIFVQVIGGGLMATNNTGNGSATTQKLAEACIIGGVTFQVVNMICCAGLMLLYARRRKKDLTQGLLQIGSSADLNSPAAHPSARSTVPHSRTEATTKEAALCRFFIYGLGLAYCLIIVRCIYRIVETIPAISADILRNEPLFLVFDGAMIFVAILTITIVHPKQCFPFLAVKKKERAKLHPVDQEIELRLERR